MPNVGNVMVLELVSVSKDIKGIHTKDADLNVFFPLTVPLILLVLGITVWTHVLEHAVPMQSVLWLTTFLHVTVNKTLKEIPSRVADHDLNKVFCANIYFLSFIYIICIYNII